MSQLKNQFWLRPIHFRLILGGFIIALSNDIMAQTGCPSGALTSGNQTIICNANAVINTAITTPDNNSTAVYDNVNVTVVNGTTIRLSGSPIGLASGSTVTNNGLLSSNTFFNAYGISFGVNGRSNTGGNSVTNTASGEIQTGGGNADGIIISSRLAGSLGNSAVNQGLITTSGAAANGIFIRSGSSNNLVANSISNAGTISTSGASAYGISLDSTSGVNSISNTGMITASGAASNAVNSLNTRNVVGITNSGTIQASGSGANAINIRGAATVTNSGTITSTSGLAINFTGTLPAGKFNTLNVNAGSVINGGIAFNQSSNQETLNFNSYSGTNFNNQITGLRNINLIGSSNVKMNSSAGYVLQGLGVNVNASSALEIAGVMSGSGSLIKDGTGTLTLSGDNTYTGGTVVNAGTLSGNTQSIQGNVNNNAITNFNQNSNGTYAGVMSGSGSLIKDGTGTLTLSGDNTYTGGTVVNAGTLSGNTQSIQGNVNNNAITNFNQNSNGTYAGVMSGSGSLIKDGTGTLTLSGDNTYTGGTVVNAGTLSGNTQSIQGNVNNNAITNFNQNSNGTYAGVMSGSGSLIKDGTGTLTLSGDNTYTGGTVVNAGGLNFLNPAITNVAIAGAGTLFGNIAITGNVSNAGNIQPSFDGAPSNLTIVGNYVGNGGTFTTQVHAPTTSPIADQLTISGAGNSGSGNTGINVVDRGGLGNATTGDGIVLVNAVNGATTSSGSFALTGRVASGAYEYQLYRGDKAGNGGAWYLRTEEENPPPVPVTPVASQRIEVALYPALPSLVRLYSMTVVDTLDQRRGDLNLVDPQGATKGGINDWARIIGKTGTSTPSTVGDGPKMNFNAYALQFGVDLYRNERLDGSRTYIGPYATIGNANGGVSNQAGTTNTGNIGMQAYSLGLYATHFASNGLYVDALAQGSRYLRAQAISVENAQIQTQGTGFTSSLEAGSRWSVGEKWIISPQAQIVYDSIGMNNASDSYGQMNFAKDETSRGRLGVMLGHQDLKAKVPVFAYLRASVWDVFQSGSNTTFQSLYGVNPVSFQSQTGSRWLAIDAQIGAKLSQHTNVFINAGWENSLVGTYQAISGRIGIQTRF
jgi:outer membrane autotransporter protein